MNKTAELIMMLLFLFTTMNIRMYPANPKGIYEWTLFVICLIVWFSPFIAYNLGLHEAYEKTKQ